MIPNRIERAVAFSGCKVSAVVSALPIRRFRPAGSRPEPVDAAEQPDGAQASFGFGDERRDNRIDAIWPLSSILAGVKEDSEGREGLVAEACLSL